MWELRSHIPKGVAKKKIIIIIRDTVLPPKDLFRGELVSYCCSNKLSQTQGLKTQIYHLAGQEVRNPKWISQVKITVLARLATFLTEALGRIIPLPFPVTRCHAQSLAHGLFLHLQSVSFQPLLLSSHLFLCYYDLPSFKVI